jgi:FkbM family methyltransferase
MNIFDVYKKYREYRITYENALSVMWKLYRGKEFIPVILRDHSKRVWQFDWVLSYRDVVNLFPENTEKIKQLIDSISLRPYKDELGEFIEFKYKNHQCKFYGVMEAARIINGDILGVFFIEDYEFLNPKKSIVIDIGANIGDTAIYFVLNDAERVIALEPFPFSYKYANINVTANKMNDKIEILNAGYGKDLEVSVDPNTISNGRSLLLPSKEGKRIKAYSLRALINMYGLSNKDNLLLKMDCEGCEYNLLDEPIEILKKFNKIEMEFHYGYKNLESKLKEAGFSVHHSKPLKSSGSEPSLRKMALINKDFTFGIIYADRHPV